MLATFVALLSLLTDPAGVAGGPNCSANADINTEEARLLDLINDQRSAHDVAPLSISMTLSRAAAWKSNDMAQHDYFGHDDAPTGRSFGDRVRDCGYTFDTWIGENIAAGNQSAADTIDQWQSGGHIENILNSNYRAVGIGRVYDGDSEFGWYWTAIFGGVVDSAPPATFPDDKGDVDCNGSVNSIDGALVLQAGAGLLGSLPCQGQADVTGDGGINARDATLILQLEAGLIS